MGTLPITAIRLEVLPTTGTKINFTYICSVHYIKAVEENAGVYNYQYIIYQEQCN